MDAKFLGVCHIFTHRRVIFSDLFPFFDPLYSRCFYWFTVHPEFFSYIIWQSHLSQSWHPIVLKSAKFKVFEAVVFGHMSNGLLCWWRLCSAVTIQRNAALSSNLIHQYGSLCVLLWALKYVRIKAWSLTQCFFFLVSWFGFCSAGYFALVHVKLFGSPEALSGLCVWRTEGLKTSSLCLLCTRCLSSKEFLTDNIEGFSRLKPSAG